MIQASYAEMEQAAREITDAASSYIGEVDQLYRVIDNLSNVWKGSDNIAFTNTVNGYKENIIALGKVVESYAIFLSKAAKALNETQSGISQAAGRL